MKRILYKGQPVLTFKMIDDLHGKDEDSTRRVYVKYNKYFVENEHYYTVNIDVKTLNDVYSGSNQLMLPSHSPDFIRGMEKEQSISFDGDIEIQNSKEAKTSVTLLTIQGYLLVVKPFTDELSWEIQNKLIDSYFEFKDLQNRIAKAEKFKLTYEKKLLSAQQDFLKTHIELEDTKERLSRFEPLDQDYDTFERAYKHNAHGITKPVFKRLLKALKWPTKKRYNRDGELVTDVYVNMLHDQVVKFIQECKLISTTDCICVHPYFDEPFKLK